MSLKAIKERVESLDVEVQRVKDELQHLRSGSIISKNQMKRFMYPLKSITKVKDDLKVLVDNVTEHLLKATEGDPTDILHLGEEKD